MKRQVEPELMLEGEQVRAYARADFNAVHTDLMGKCFQYYPTCSGTIADLGCGPGDITLRLARQYLHGRIHAFDGSSLMLGYALQNVKSRGFADRVRLQYAVFPDVGELGQRFLRRYDMIVSNSLLHHLHDPQVLWQVIKDLASPRATIFIADLRRPDSEAQAQHYVNEYAAGEPAVLQRDFYNSLCAAFTVSEVREQIQANNMNLNAVGFGDRHIIIHGVLD